MKRSTKPNKDKELQSLLLQSNWIYDGDGVYLSSTAGDYTDLKDYGQQVTAIVIVVTGERQTRSVYFSDGRVISKDIEAVGWKDSRYGKQTGDLAVVVQQNLLLAVESDYNSSNLVHKIIKGR